MKKKTSKRRAKLWGYTYVLDGHPSNITYRDRSVLVLDVTLPSQMRNVRRILRALNGGKVTL